jgi:ankyrin repeat protein
MDQQLFDAATENNLRDVRRLLRAGADIETKDSDNFGFTPLHAACFHGHVQVFNELLEHGADVEANANRGFTPLQFASCEGHMQVLKALLSVGADVNATTEFGSTALTGASNRGHVQVVMELVKHGADIEAKDGDGMTPLHNAAMEGQLTVVNELLSPSDSNGASTSILGKRKTRGADIEAKDRDGDTPLHIASLYNHLSVVGALLSGGANILAANTYGRLPIDKAVRGGHSGVAEYLLWVFYATRTRLPLHEVLEDLTWIGNPNSSDVPPLRAALHQDVLGTDDVVEILEFLVSQNSEWLRLRDPDGSLPLHVACRRGASFIIVQSLVNLYKASVKSVTSQGDLPIFLACEMPKTSLDTIFLLMKQYPDVVYRCSLEN